MSVFEGSDTQTETNPLENLVGEGKKFKSVEDLAKGKLEADRFIEQLQEEAKKRQAELDARMSVEEALAKVKEQRPEVTAQDTNEDRQGKELPDIEGMVRKTYENLTAQEKVNQNLVKADQSMTNKFGDKAREIMEQRAKTLGMSLQDVRDVAAKSPSAFENLMGLNTPQSSGPRPVAGGDVNTAAFNQGTTSNAEVRLAELKTLQKTNSRNRFDPKISAEIYKLKEQIALGG